MVLIGSVLLIMKTLTLNITIEDDGTFELGDSNGPIVFSQGHEGSVLELFDHLELILESELGLKKTEPVEE